ncbi:protein PLASTID MOVEMENT IMPAIRED 2-like [Andrographis paniculata]|uniref:protein PLASTID MOVEMENT IMPAIRED 2-like n=1 Tax=Andrographis paniculata TaxID=175694 RepID=UPI0021E7C135|nr:protein PLASTID MOVEMENT IMPAIRED 2-like [Andrographis paniculata]
MQTIPAKHTSTSISTGFISPSKDTYLPTHLPTPPHKIHAQGTLTVMEMVEVERLTLSARRETGSVKAAAATYRETLLQSKFQVYAKNQGDQIHQARFMPRVEESNLRARGLEKPSMDQSGEEEEWSSERECAKVMRELEFIKQEVRQLKLDMAIVLEEKRRADKEREFSSMSSSYLSSVVEKVKWDIEDVNEKQVLVELARIEALKEYQQVEDQRLQEKQRYTAKTEEARKKKQDMIEEIEEAAELENNLAGTLSDVSMLSDKLKQVKEENKGLERMETWRNKAMSDDIQEGDTLESASVLQSVVEKLEAAKKELKSVKEESFQFMSSMDIVRNEHKQVGDELAKLRSKEKKSEMIIENLRSKLFQAKAKLEATSAAEDKAKSMALNILVTLEQLKSEAEAAKQEQALISERIAIIRAEVQNAETQTYLAEERLQLAQQDLEAAKLAEAAVLENLKALTEKTMRDRASSSRPSSRITISRFEYEYLTGHAAGAREIGDKKIAAAQAWIEALKASEKEIQIKSELLRQKGRELQMEEQHITKRSMSLRRMAEDDFGKWRQRMEPEKQMPSIALPTKAMNRSVKMTPARRGKARAVASPLVRGSPRTTSFTVRRRRKAMPNLAKFFSRKSTERYL